MSSEESMVLKMNPEAYLEMSKTESSHWWFVGRRAIIRSALDGLSLNANAKILEVGCGTGGNLDLLSNYGAVSAFEMDEGALQFAIAKSKSRTDPLDIRSGYCPDGIPFKNQTFDLICMFDVLEHIQNDFDTLVGLRELLNPGGFLLVTLPAHQWLYGPHDLFLHHKRRYAYRGIVNLMKLAGFESIRVSYFNTVLFPLAVISRLKDRLIDVSGIDGISMPSKIVNSCLKFFFLLERHIIGSINLPYGVSLLGIFKAKEL